MIKSLLSEDSPLRIPEYPLSRKQILFLDGIRYAAEMAHIAYQKLSCVLQEISRGDSASTVSNSAEALQYAWAIVDSTNRFRDLLQVLPGLKSEPWKRQLVEKTKSAAILRDCVQHQAGEINKLVESGGQLWGYLSWVKMENHHPTPHWFMLSGGSSFVGDRWFYVGPIKLPYDVPNDRIRLNAFNHQIYLWILVSEIESATKTLEAVIRSKSLRLVGEPTNEFRGADQVYSGTIEIFYSVKSNAN